MTCTPRAFQMGLFGGPGSTRRSHVVAAHTRLLADGTEVFVAEHRRANRSRQPARAVRRRAQPREASQEELFGPRLEGLPPYVMCAVELLPGAWQLPLWPASSSTLP